jgi:hypothetical protein
MRTIIDENKQKQPKNKHKATPFQIFPVYTDADGDAKWGNGA